MIDNDNPIGILGIDHLEFATNQYNGPSTALFYMLGFKKSYEHVNKDRALFTQGQIRFLINAENNTNSHAFNYFKKHGEGVSKISFEVKNAEQAIETAVKRGANCIQNLKTVNTEAGEIKSAIISGFGDVLNEFVEKPKNLFRENYKKFENEVDPLEKPLTTRVARIDHLTNNVEFGERDRWVQFYKKIYGFSESRYFDIKGFKTGLESTVVQLKNGSVIIPINEPSERNSKSQIQEFLDLHKGPGVQHIALSTPNIISTLDELQNRGMKFLNVPHTYYEDIPKRKIVVEENMDALKRLNILVDGDEKGYLLQIFSQTYIGPLFFEYIQRKNNLGFGEGNFQALFDAIERDQIERGYLK